MHDRDTFDELYGYAEKILDELQRTANEKNSELKAAHERHERLTKKLRGLLDDAPEEANPFGY